ncbi:GIY-YIG nuclease family protein [Elusimicrobiota bacterium]
MFNQENTNWWVYIAQAADGSYYTGMTRDMEKRKQKHNSHSGSLWARAKGDFEILWTEKHLGSSSTRIRESQLKGWTRRKKEALISGNLELLKKL